MYRILVRLGIVIVTALGIVSLEGAAAQEPAAAPTATPSPVVGDQIGIPYGPEPHQILDLRLPDASEYRGARPVIVYLHSGGWIGGERGNVPEVVLTQIGRGYAVASADYRLATATPDGQRPASFPGVIWDVKRVVRFLKEKATTWNLDPRRIVLTGTSAGGYLAAFVARRPDCSSRLTSRRPRARGATHPCGPSSTWSARPISSPSSAPITPGRRRSPPASSAARLRRRRTR